MLRKSALLLVLGAVGACGVFGAAETDTPDEATDAGDSGTAPPSEAGVEPDAPAPAVDSGVDASKCDPVDETKEEVTSEADGLLATDNVQLFGAFDICNMNVGRCVFRFKPTPAAMAAMRDQRVVALALTLTRADTSSHCSGSCTNLRDDGTLTAQPLRTDWNEATMNWPSRDVNSPWGAAGATAPNLDVATDTFSLGVLASTLAPTITLDPSRWPAGFLASDKIAVLTSFQNAGASKQFPAITHEALGTAATPKSPPKLTIRYCP